MNNRKEFWYWIVNRETKSVCLMADRGRFTRDRVRVVMDFSRWGISGACPRFGEKKEGLLLLDRVCDRDDWIKPFPGREHHASWCVTISHDDADLITAAPDMLEALEVSYSILMKREATTLEFADAITLIQDALKRARGEE